MDILLNFQHAELDRESNKLWVIQPHYIKHIVISIVLPLHISKISLVLPVHISKISIVLPVHISKISIVLPFHICQGGILQRSFQEAQGPINRQVHSQQHSPSSYKCVSRETTNSVNLPATQIKGNVQIAVYGCDSQPCICSRYVLRVTAVWQVCAVSDGCISGV